MLHHHAAIFQCCLHWRRLFFSTFHLIYLFSACMKNGAQCSYIYSVCYQAIHQLSRRTLTSSARRQVENKVAQKQKLFQVSWSDYSHLTDNDVHIWRGSALAHISLCCVCFCVLFVFLYVEQLSFIAGGQKTPENSLQLTDIVATPCSLHTLLWLGAAISALNQIPLSNVDPELRTCACCSESQLTWPLASSL